MRILLAGRISRRALFPAACATGVLYVAIQAVFSLVFSAMVISDEHTYGPIGTIFALLSYLIAIGVVVILGAVAGRAWNDRSPGKSQVGHLPLPCRPQSPPDARIQGRRSGDTSGLADWPPAGPDQSAHPQNPADRR